MARTSMYYIKFISSRLLLYHAYTIYTDTLMRHCSILDILYCTMGESSGIMKANKQK